MCGGCLSCCCVIIIGLDRICRGAFRRIRARLVRRNVRQVDVAQQGGTLNTVGCPDDGLPSSTKTVRYEQFFTEETTATSSVPGNKRTIQRNGKYRSVGQSPPISRQEDPCEGTSSSQPPSGSSRQDSSSLEPIVSSTGTTPLHGNIVRSSSPPSVSVQQDSPFSTEHSEAMMLTQQAAAHMKNTSTFDNKALALIMKAYECYKKDHQVNKSNRKSATFRESANSSSSATVRGLITFRERASSSRNPSQEDGRDTLVSHSPGSFEDSFIFSYDERLSSRSYTMARRRFQASPLDRSLMRPC